MKLSQYAKQQGISYRTALRWFKDGTIIVTIDEQASPQVQKVAIYARVSSSENTSNLESQAERLVAYCTAKGYQVAKAVTKDKIHRMLS